MHPGESSLRAYIDHELSLTESESISRHLKECDPCNRRFSELASKSNFVSTKIKLLDGTEPAEPSQAIFAEVQQRHIQTHKTFRGISKPFWASVAAALIIVVIWQFGMLRVWAVEFLSLFRVQQIAVVPIDPASVQQLHDQFFDSDRNRPRIEQLFSDQVHVVKQGTAQTVSSANAAATVAGFGVRLPAKFSAPTFLRTQPAADVSVQIDVEKVQAILDDGGRGDIRIPEDLDGQYVNFHIPASVTALYGKCPDLQDKEAESSEHEVHMSDYPECKVMVQVPSPSVAAPPSLNVAQLGQAMLQLLGMPENEARKFSENIDWTSTLVIPLPMDRRMKFSEIQVDGVKGTLFSSEPDGEQELHAYNLLWIRDGILYSIMGQGPGDEAIAIANSLQ